MLRTISCLHEISIPRDVYASGVPVTQQLFAFSDASDVAIAYVVYLRIVTDDDQVHVAFLSGNWGLIPRDTNIQGQPSIPRAELSAANALGQVVLQIQNDVKEEITFMPTQFFTDSEDVMDWINNNTDSFKQYIARKRDRSCQVADPSQWHCIPGPDNPADIGTRSISVDKLLVSEWIAGHKFLRSKELLFPGDKKLSELKTIEQFKQEMKNPDVSQHKMLH